VDATAHGSLASRFKVSGYPTLFVFRNGKDSPYNGPREAPGIIEYMKKQVGPAAKPLATEADFKTFTTLSADRDYVIVGFFPPAKAKSSQLYSAFMVLANKLRDDVVFGVVSDTDIIKKQVDADEAIVAYKSYDDKKAVYRGEPRKQLVEDWLQTQSLPIVGEITADKEQRYSKRGLPIARCFMKVDWSSANTKHMTYYTSRLEKVATEYTNRIVVAVADIHKYDQHKVEDAGLTGKDFGLVIEKGRQRYRMEKAFSEANLKKFFSDFFDNKLEAYIKSAPAPEPNDGPVKVVVGTNFQSIVNDPDKDVLLEFYAPWCGHCKQLAPKFDKLGEKFKDLSNIVIAKIDATANDYPSEYEVSGYPTIYFKPAGKHSRPIRFEGGEREVSDFVSFIKKHAVNPVTFKKKK